MGKSIQERYFTIKDVERIISKIVVCHGLRKDKDLEEEPHMDKVKPSEISDDEIEMAFERAAQRVRLREK